MGSRTRAVIDIGTNSVLLLVARRGEGGRVDIVLDEARITRLGRGVDRDGRLHPESVERTLAVLDEYRGIARDYDAELVAVATEGLRMASDREGFLARAQHRLACPIRIVSGDEEAELSYLSVAQETASDGPLRVLDIGGGSTELVAGHGATIESRCSHPIGSVRLTERFVRNDPPTSGEVSAMKAAAHAAFAGQPVEPFEVLHGLAGTVTTAAALLLELEAYDRDAVDRFCVPVADVTALRDELAAEPLAQRVRRPLLPEGRADVIVAGLSILEAALEHCGATSLIVRDRGLRYALV